jgi:hypothetical protein
MLFVPTHTHTHPHHHAPTLLLSLLVYRLSTSRIIHLSQLKAMTNTVKSVYILSPPLPSPPYPYSRFLTLRTSPVPSPSLLLWNMTPAVDYVQL